MTATLPLFAPSQADTAANLLSAARALAAQLNRSRVLDRKLVSGVMTTTFGASDVDGAWSWRDAYDAIEAALVLQIRRLAPQVARLEDAPAEICALLASLSALTPTQSRRSEEQVALDQFSTPPELGALAVLAAQVRLDDKVLEPSAGTGLLAVLAEVCGAQPRPSDRGDGSGPGSARRLLGLDGALHGEKGGSRARRAGRPIAGCRGSGSRPRSTASARRSPDSARPPPTHRRGRAACRPRPVPPGCVRPGGRRRVLRHARRAGPVAMRSPFRGASGRSAPRARFFPPAERPPNPARNPPVATRRQTVLSSTAETPAQSALLPSRQIGVG